MAYDFDGSGQYLTFTRTYSSVTAWSCAMWINLDAKAAYDGLLVSRSSGSQGLIISGAAGDADLGYLWEASADEYNAASMLQPANGTWNLIGMAVSSTAATLFQATRNGTVSSWTNTKTHTAKSPSAWNLGRDSFGTRLIDGRIAEFAMWSATLTADDFAQMARGFCPAFIKPASLNVYMPLVRDLVDIREGVAITNNGSATVADHCPIIWRSPSRAGTFGATAVVHGVDPVVVSTAVGAANLQRTLAVAGLGVSATPVGPTTVVRAALAAVGSTFAVGSASLAYRHSVDAVTAQWLAMSPTIGGTTVMVTAAQMALSSLAPVTRLSRAAAPIVLTISPASPAVGAAGNYRIYERVLPDGTDTLIATVSSSELEYLLVGLAGRETWWQVRAVTHCGVEDIEPVRLVRVAFDGAGNLILPVPNAPIGLRLVRGAAGGVTAIWSYLTTGQADAPAVFNVYVAEDGAAFDLGSPANTVTYVAGRRRFEADLGSFADGTLVRCIVRAEADSGAEEANLVEASIVADAAAPEPASSISVEVSAS